MRGPTSDCSYAIRLPPPQTDTIVQHEIANVSLAFSVPVPPTPCEIAYLGSPATAVEPTFDRSLCVETYPGMSLGPEVEAVSYTHLRGHETRHDLVCRLLLEKKK